MKQGRDDHFGKLAAPPGIIKLAQKLLIDDAAKLAEVQVGALRRLDRVYELVEGNIGSDVRAGIVAIAKQLSHPDARMIVADDPLDFRAVTGGCLFRRIALRAGGLVPDSTTYRDAATRRHSLYELNAFENHASRLRACRAFDDLVDLDPDARFATTLPLSELLVNGAPGEAVFAMYHRYAVETQAYFDAARRKVINLPRQPRKEREPDLFSAVR